MFYTTKAESGMRYDPFKAIVAPRPIGWIGTLNENRVPNLGPYSYFNAIASDPNIVMFASDGWKHSASNAKRWGEFTFSLATLALRDAMNVSSEHYDDGANEFERAGLEMGRSRLIEAPFVAASPAAFECKLISAEEVVALDGASTGWVQVIGQVVGTHIDDKYLSGGLFDAQAANAIARCGYKNYTTADTLWEMNRPDMAEVPDGRVAAR